VAPRDWLRASRRRAVRKPSALRFDWIAVEELCVALSGSPYPFQVPIPFPGSHFVDAVGEGVLPPWPGITDHRSAAAWRIRAKALNNC